MFCEFEELNLQEHFMCMIAVVYVGACNIHRFPNWHKYLFIYHAFAISNLSVMYLGQWSALQPLPVLSALFSA